MWKERVKKFRTAKTNFQRSSSGNAGFRQTHARPKKPLRNKLMKMTCIKPNKIQQALGLVLCLGALPLLGMTGCTTTDHHSDLTAGQRVDDRETTSRVKDALSADPLYKFSGVNVETYKGTVQLSGFVTANEQKSRAADLAGNVAGVREVANNITVKGTDSTGRGTDSTGKGGTAN